ncbi:protein terminal ear1 homolog [Gastrolobium bilobum]|uniref:protein terminal ear1 homolog n=1 Tax=Gastrolobium bilobum TaxID=150636 RepID=UPI002AB16C2B|nr:protein terminal ear1 homolog [Gastrolobium bilobum]
MGSLDPTAEEFRPKNPNHGDPPPVTYFRPTFSPPCDPYACPYAPTGGLETATFFYGGGVIPVGVIPYPLTHFSYVGPPALAAPPATAPLSTSPTRSLLLSFVPSETAFNESTLRREMKVFGDVRGVQMEGLREGTVTVHFYDLRHAETALTAIRWQHMQHQATTSLTFFNTQSLLLPAARGVVADGSVWAHYILPACDAVPEGQNQGTIVVFNLDSEVYSDSLREIFEAFGPIKEFRHTPSKKDQRFVEFFDIRDAAKALKHMNGKEIRGKTLVIKFSHDRKFISKSKSVTFPPSSPQSQRKFWPRLDPDATIISHFSRPQKKSTFTAMASIKLDEVAGNAPKRNFIEKHSSESTVEGTKHQQPPARNKYCRGKQAKKHETRFLIKEDATAESSCMDSRTSVMIKNIPNKYSLKLLLNMLDNHCIQCNEQIKDGDDQLLSSYDFVYLPIDFNNKCNVGYGFVNMTSPEATLRLYKAFHLQPWEVFNSRKICQVTYARVQGLEALKEHFKNSKFPYEMEEYLPAVFSPPRDGKQLTEPLKINVTLTCSRIMHNSQFTGELLSSILMNKRERKKEKEK